MDQFTADPSARVFEGKVYVYPSHDIKATPKHGRVGWFCMKDYHVFSSENLTDCPYKATGYQSSKTALNMYTINLAFDLRETNFKVNSVCPGFTSTDINNHQGHGTVEDAAKRVIKYAMIDNDGPSGKFFSEEYFPNTECPW